MAKKIDYTTIEEQIKSLKDKELLFIDENSAKVYLARYGYYSIINSYKEPYQITINGKRKYTTGTTFEQIHSMFTFDHNLRNSIMSSMLDLEECLRAATAEVIAYKFGTDHNTYLNYRNFRDHYSSNPKFTLSRILGTLWNNTNSDKDPIKYYREKYHIVPPWILLKGTYFSTLINLIKFLKKEQKQHLIRILLRIPLEEEITPEITTLFQTILFICLDYRNTAAHGGRIYNFQSQHTSQINISGDTIRIFPALKNAKNSSGIQLLLILLSIFKDRQPRTIIHDSLEQQLNRHLSDYPNDVDILAETMGVSIQSKQYVWVNEKTKTYHSNEFCSGMINAKRTAYDNINHLTYHPCKRCL